MRHKLLILVVAAFVAGTGIAQDECGVAVALSLGTNPTPAASGNTFTMTGATLSAGWNSPPSCTATLSSADVWFTFVPSSTGVHQIDTEWPAGFAGGTLTDTLLEVYNDLAGPCVPSAPLACDDDSGVTSALLSLLTVSLTSGSTYYVRCEDWGTFSGGTFYINVSFLGSPVANDECAGAVALSTGVNPTPVASGNRFSNIGATTSAGWPALSTCPTATAAINLDTWFAFTPGVTDTYSFSTDNPCGFTAGTMTNTTIALYDGSVVSCAVPAAHMICDGDSGVGSLSLLSAALTAGTTYFLRVGTTGTTGAASVNATFYVTVTQGPLPGVANDECAGAVVLGLGTNPAPAISCNLYSNDGATTSAGWPALSTCPTATAAINNDVWFSFTPGVSDTYFFDTNNPCGFTAGSMTNTTIALYDGSVVSCAVPAAHLICDGDSGVGSLSALSAALTAGTTYFLRVGASATTGNGTFYVNIAQGSAAVPNDECTSPLSVALGINPAPGVSCFTYDNTFATTSAGWPTPCATTINDLWFSFVPTTTGNYVLSTDTPAGFAAGTNTDTVLSVHDATCIVGPAIGCDDDSGVSPALNSQLTITLIGGTPYMIRIGSFSATTTGSFYLTISRVFSLTFTSPLGPGSIQADIAAGPSLGTYFMCVTFNPVGFPTGYFFGITPSIQEIVSQAAGFPFVGPLNATGDFVLGPVGGLPSGVLTLYAVALGFDTAVLDVPTVVSTPESYLVP